MPDRLDRLEGIILGTAVGDALGLPREGLSSHRARALYGGSPLHHRFFFGRGMVSDDTDHTCLVGQALLRHPDDSAGFARSLAWGLRGWFATIPAGIGKATLLSCLKLWLGYPPTRSGVWSAGNGPAMRSALLGVVLGDNPVQLREYVRVCTRITHTDPRAEAGALLVALAAYHGSKDCRSAYLDAARLAVQGQDEWTQTLDQMRVHQEQNASVGDFARALGLHRGVSGYILHTVPVALYAWLRHPENFRRAVEEVILLGGDTDTTGAIIGALMGASLGAQAIPPEWMRLCEWPRSIPWMRRLASALSADSQQRPPRIFWPALWLRNLLFLFIVLCHLLRRCFPPYRPRDAG